ncbi:hypothetical protein MJT46_004714 [Ovis ammon polii x Ovis aries]|nr:hypothetical protein MJT46_004714 [Ovis ammon polii x Ovis aries]
MRGTSLSLLHTLLLLPSPYPPPQHLTNSVHCQVKLEEKVGPRPLYISGRLVYGKINQLSGEKRASCRKGVLLFSISFSFHFFPETSLPNGFASSNECDANRTELRCLWLPPPRLLLGPVVLLLLRNDSFNNQWRQNLSPLSSVSLYRLAETGEVDVHTHRPWRDAPPGAFARAGTLSWTHSWAQSRTRTIPRFRPQYDGAKSWAS